MKRYKYILDKNLNGELYIRTYITDDGEWVRYKDVKLMIETKPPEITIKSIECNCVEKSDSARKKASAWLVDSKGLFPQRLDWICSAHGYKRL